MAYVSYRFDQRRYFLYFSKMIQAVRERFIFDRHFYFGLVTSPLTNKRHGRNALGASLVTLNVKWKMSKLRNTEQFGNFYLEYSA